MSFYDFINGVDFLNITDNDIKEIAIYCQVGRISKHDPISESTANLLKDISNTLQKLKLSNFEFTPTPIIYDDKKVYIFYNEAVRDIIISKIYKYKIKLNKLPHDNSVTTNVDEYLAFYNICAMLLSEYPQENIINIRKQLKDFYSSFLQNSFVAPDTTPQSIVITGTTGCGKSTTLYKLKNKYNFDILKCSYRGGVKHRIDNQLIALSMQIAQLFDVDKNPQSAHDRSPLDHLFWRIILYLLDNFDATIEHKLAEDVIIDLFWGLYCSIPKIFWQYIGVAGYNYIISESVPNTIHRMISRGNGSDMFRPLNPHYINVQNLVYGIMSWGNNLYTVSEVDQLNEKLDQYISSQNLPENEDVVPFKTEYNNSDEVYADSTALPFCEAIGLLK